MKKEIPQISKKETENLKHSSKLKENLNNFIKLKISIAYLYKTLLEKLKQDAFTIDQANKIINDYQNQYNLPKELSKKISNLVKSILDKKAKIKEITQKYPNKEELFFVLLGKKPIGEIEIIVRPLAIYIKCFDSKDFYNLLNINFPSTNKILAVNLPTCQIKDLAGLIIIENSLAIQGSKYSSESILSHEEQHIIDRLIFILIFGKKILDKKKFQVIRQSLPDDISQMKYEQKIQFIRKLARKFINNYLGPELKSEIFAHLKMGESIENIFIRLASNIEPNKIYFFWDQNKKKFINKILKIFPNESSIAEEILKKEYKSIMNNARISLNLLTQEISNLDVDTIIGLLNNEDLIKWLRTTRILIKTLTSVSSATPK